MKRFLKWFVGVVAVLVLVAVLFLYWPLYTPAPPKAENERPVDVVLVGGGIMSVTLATFLQELEPGWKIHLYERLDDVALESSNGWNNAGTGHSAFAELNYTPELPDGSIETKRAVGIAEQFEVSRQFWSHQVRNGRLGNPADFINPTPHMSFVWGEDRIEYLRKRHEALVRNPLFYGMQFSTDPAQIQRWAPLVMEGRDPNQKVAATYMPLGTDVNFGVLTQQLTDALRRSPNFQLHLRHEVRGLSQNGDKTWSVTVNDLTSDRERTIKSRYVFIGAGGAALKLLQMSGIPESKNYAGFPVGGQFLAFRDPAITRRHQVKVYGMADTGSPPMSVPHIDARKLDGKQVMLFGPFALYSTKFLKDGSWFDLYSSVNHNNVGGMMRVGEENLDLVKYLMQQAGLDDDDRQAELVKYFPKAQRKDWQLITAGQRVQIIKRNPETGEASLEFGTELVTDKDHTISALLGASPGASTSPPIMLKLLAQAFPEQMKGQWQARISEIVPSYGQELNKSAALTNHIRRMTSQTLQLPFIQVPEGPGSGLQPAPAAEPAVQSQPEVVPEDKRDKGNREMQSL